MPSSDGRNLGVPLRSLFLEESKAWSQLHSLEFTSSSNKTSARCQLLGGRRWRGQVRDGAEREGSEGSWCFVAALINWFCREDLVTPRLILNSLCNQG